MAVIFICMPFFLRVSFRDNYAIFFSGEQGAQGPESASIVEYGDNRLSIALKESDPEAHSPTIVIDEVEVYVEPR